MAWASKRRFPTLLLVVGGLFVVDLVVPDLVPAVDEIILGLMTLALARWRDRRKAPEPPAAT
jgi:hypothetical protein